MTTILFASTGFREARRALAREMPKAVIHACDPADIREAVAALRPDVLVPCVATLPPDVAATPTLLLIHQFGVGLEGVDVPAATGAGVWVANVPAADVGNADSVAEHAVMFLLALSRRLPQARADMVARRVAEPAGQALFHKTALLVGLGDIGLEIARRLVPFRMRLIAVRRDPRRPVPDDAGIDHVFGPEEIGEALAQAHYVILCAPLTPETHHVIGAEALGRMRPGSYLINVGRGGLVDQEALLAALESGHLAGAGLDVFWEEPVDPDHPLFGCNVIATPHVAGLTDTSCAGMAAVMAENVRRVLRGQVPLYAANAPTRPRNPKRGLAGPLLPHRRL